ncbi:MAG: hypothetical protein R6X32_23815 [Chloroflexota bacterium]|jgi:hypothetical protein
MKLKPSILSSLGLMIVILFVSCQSETEPSSATSPTVTITNTIRSQSTPELTTTSLPTPTNITTVMTEITLDPIVKPAASATIVSGLATPNIIGATLTPLPTLEGEELEIAIAELLANPMNCDVPCWWGAIPGITSLNEIKHSISPYSFDLYEHQVNGEVVYLRLGIGYIEERNDFSVRVAYNFSHSILIGITAYSPSISEFLAEYGSPDEVWLETMSFELEGGLPFRLNLVYMQEGMAAGYVVDGNIQNGMVIGCFAEKQTGRLRLIMPNNVISHKDFSPIFEQDRHYLRLEEATDITIDDFMQIFRDHTQPQCIKTPAELWNG